MNLVSIMQENLFSSNDLDSILRTLWFEHVVWTRLFTISSISKLDDLDPVTKRLLKNPGDFATLFDIYYGSDNASKFEKLLREHLLIAADLIKSSIDGDTKKAAMYEKNWYKNADEIAAFLSEINPYIDYNEMKDLLHEHLAMTKAQAVYRLQKQYDKDVKNFDSIENQAILMADVMSKAMNQQFHSK